MLGRREDGDGGMAWEMAVRMKCSPGHDGGQGHQEAGKENILGVRAKGDQDFI